jgi:hypothetical protein
LTKNRSGGKRLIASFTKILFAYHPSSEIAERRFRKSFQNPKVRIKNKSFALTGPVDAVKVEADGDLHLALQMRPVISRESWSAKYRQNALVSGTPNGF